MRIAVASQNFRTVTGHAGKTRRFLVFEVAPDQPAREVERFDLPKDMSMHEFHGEGDHPLYTVNAVIATSAGDGFARRLAGRGVLAATTEETDPVRAAEGLVAMLEQMRQNPPMPDLRGSPHQHHHHHDHDHGHGGCGGHDHDHDHDHHHGHSGGHSGGCSCGG